MASSTTQLILSALTLLGIGGVIGGYFTHILAKNKELQFKILELKEKRYRSCILFMDAYFHPENTKYLSSRHPDIDGAYDVAAYLRMEYQDMLFYAPKTVALSVKAFIDAPSDELYLRSILLMRKDLWTKQADLTLEEVRLKNHHQ